MRKCLPLTNMRYISGWVVNVCRLLMVRDINYSVGKFSRGFNSPLTKAEIKHKIIVKVEILLPNTLHNVRQRNIVRIYGKYFIYRFYRTTTVRVGFNFASKCLPLELEGI